MEEQLKNELPLTPAQIIVDGETATGRPVSIAVSQLRLGDYEQAAKLMDSGDEFARMTLATGLPLNTIMDLSPRTYEAICGADLAVNAYFFSFAGRRAQTRLVKEKGLGALAFFASLAGLESLQANAGNSPSKSSLNTQEHARQA